MVLVVMTNHTIMAIYSETKNYREIVIMSKSYRKFLIIPLYRSCRFSKKIYHGAYRARVRNKLHSEDFDRIDGYRVRCSDAWDWKEYLLHTRSDFNDDNLARELIQEYHASCLGDEPTYIFQKFCDINHCTKATFMQNLNPLGLRRYRAWLIAKHFGK